MAGILVSPRFDSQIRKRSALYKKRNESPKFRDILRERCHARIRASRCALIEKFRNTSDTSELHNTLYDIVKEEVKTLKSKLLCSKGFCEAFEVTEEIEELNNEDYWLIAEYEKVLAEEEASFNADWENKVICPLCEMSVLNFDGRSPACLKCQIHFPPVESAAALKSSLDSVLMNHSSECDDSAYFAMLADNELSGLFLICESCLQFSQVI